MNTRSLTLCACLLVAISCAETRPDSFTARRGLEAPNVSDEAVPQPATRTADPEPTGPVVEDIDWEEARGFKRISPAALPESERPKLAEIRVPVLAFDDDRLLASGRLSHHGNWYVLAVESDDGLNMNIRGTRNAWQVPGMQVPEAAEDYTLTRTHGIITVSWRSFGASYSLDVECARPMADTRCTESAFALQTAESLALIGGTP